MEMIYDKLMTYKSIHDQLRKQKQWDAIFLLLRESQTYNKAIDVANN